MQIGRYCAITVIMLIDTVMHFNINDNSAHSSSVSFVHHRSMFGKKILGYPIRLQNESYARNAFYFNLCFVFQPTTRTIAYEPIVKKLTEHLISLERSEKILSQIKMPANEERIRAVLTRVRNDINRDKVCMLKGESSQEWHNSKIK